MSFTLDYGVYSADSCNNAWNYLNKFFGDYEFDDTTPTPMNPIRIYTDSYSKLAYDMCNSYVARHCPKSVGGRRRSKIQQRRSGSKQQRRSRQGKQRNLQGGNLQQRRQRLQRQQQEEEQEQQQQQQQQQQQGGLLSKLFNGISLIGNMLKNAASKQSPTPARSSSKGASPLPAAPSASESSSNSCCAPKCAQDRSGYFNGCGSCSGPDYKKCTPLRSANNPCGKALKAQKDKVEACS